jgi:hypothetical protein
LKPDVCHHPSAESYHDNVAAHDRQVTAVSKRLPIDLKRRIMTMRKTAAQHDPVTRHIRASVFLTTSEAGSLTQMLQARQAWGEWLKQYIWHHYVTLTCSDPRRSEAAAHAQFRRWIRCVEQRAQRAIGWFVALERGAGGLIHHHVLTVGTDELDGQALAAAWPLGLVDAPRYDPARGAAYYLGKDIGTEVLELGYDIAPPEKLMPVSRGVTQGSQIGGSMPTDLHSSL